MVSGVSDVGSTWLLPLWVAGVVVLGIVLAYAIYRAGYLRRDERERLDRNTRTIQRAEEPPEMEHSESPRAEEPTETQRAPPLVDLQPQAPAPSPEEETAAASPQHDNAASAQRDPEPRQDGSQPRQGTRRQRPRKRR